MDEGGKLEGSRWGLVMMLRDDMSDEVVSSCRGHQM
jgi:hypothetical protein